LRSNASNVSSWVEPGVGSALLKFGFTNRSLPWNCRIPRRSIARRTPVARSVVLIKATGTIDAGTWLRSTALNNDGASIMLPKLVALLRNSRRFMADLHGARPSSALQAHYYWTPTSGNWQLAFQGYSSRNSSLSVAPTLRTMRSL